jgi:hypothetical protein
MVSQGKRQSKSCGAAAPPPTRRSTHALRLAHAEARDFCSALHDALACDSSDADVDVKDKVGAGAGTRRACEVSLARPARAVHHAS